MQQAPGAAAAAAAAQLVAGGAGGPKLTCFAQRGREGHYGEYDRCWKLNGAESLHCGALCPCEGGCRGLREGRMPYAESFSEYEEYVVENQEN